MPSDRYFRALSERSRELVSVTDEQGRVRYANPAFFRMLGYTSEEVIGRPGVEFVAEEDRERFLAERAATLSAPGGTLTTELTVVCRDGGRRVLSVIAQNLLDDPDVNGVVVNSHDITARHRAERRLAHIAAHVPGMVYQYVLRPDGSGEYTFVSEGARRLFGIDPDEALRDPRVLLNIVHPDEYADFRAKARRAAADLTPFRWEGRALLPDGRERFVQVVSIGEHQADGTVLSDGIITDVTPLQEANRRLEEREQHFRSLFDQNPDAVFSFDLQGYFVSANAACYRLTGYEPGSFVGQPFEPLVWPDDLDASRANFLSAASGTPQRWEVSIRHRDGRRIRLHVTNLPIVVGGQVVGVFGIAKDVTAQLELEQRLLQAQKMEAVGRLAGGIAHDFNNLIQVVEGYTALAAGVVPTHSTAVQYLGEVATAASRAATLTRQLLAFSRQQVLQPRPLDANETVTEVAGMLRRVIGEDITLQLELAPSLWPVHADPGQLVQVLMNLAINARDAMPSGGTLRLRTANRAVTSAEVDGRPGLAPGDYAALIVEDTGVGIDAATLPLIFEPFFTTKPLGQGTGLGLSTVYGIVKQSDGFVYVESTPREGSRFTVLLPRIPGRAASRGDTAPAPPRGTETILLVEDEAPVRRAVRRMLELSGYTVLDAANGNEAMQVAAQAEANGQAVDLLLTDVVMPQQSGRALSETLTAHWPHLRVLFMSGYTDDEIIRRGIGSGARLLEKPFSADQLANAVREALDRPPPAH
jgi:PAS domain S-box-containing protein